MSRLLLDMGLPRRAAADLRDLGHDVMHVADCGMAHAEDLQILEAARADSRTVITLDRDFTNLLAVEGQSAPSVIYIRVAGFNRERAVHLIQELMEQLPAEGRTCYVATVSSTGIRIRTLPI